jgi:hypothetical protein
MSPNGAIETDAVPAWPLARAPLIVVTLIKHIYTSQFA